MNKKENKKIEKNIIVGGPENFAKLYAESTVGNYSSCDCYISKTIKNPEYTERENGSKGIVMWGNSNMFPQELIDLTYSVPEQQAIITKISSLTAGQGIYIPTNISSGLKKFLANDNGEVNLSKLSMKIAWDTSVFGGFALEVQWSTNGIGAINHIPLQNLRVALPKEGRPDGYMYCKNWSKTNKFKPEFIAAYDPKLNKKEYPNQVYFAKYNDFATQVYCLPMYFGALNEIILAYEISTFHLKGIQNGLYPTVLMTFFEQPEQEIRKEHYEKINSQYGGAENANKALIFYCQDPTLKPEITIIDPINVDEHYLQLYDIITQKIITGWGITNPEIVGIPQPKGISSSANDIIFATYRLQNEVIDPIQKFIEENLNELAKQNGIYESITLNKAYDDEKFAMLMTSFGGGTAQVAQIQKEDETQQDKNNTL